MRKPALSILVAGLCAATHVGAQEAAGDQVFALDAVVQRPSSLVAPLPRAAWIAGTREVGVIERIDGIDVAGRRLPDAKATTRAFDAVELQRAILAAAPPAEKEKAENEKTEKKPDQAPPPAQRIPPITWLDRDRVRLVLPDGIYHWTIGSDQADRVLTAPGTASASAVAEDDAAGAWVVEHDLIVVDRDGRQSRVTEDGSGDIVYGGAAHRAEFGITNGLWWDDAGERLAFSREDMAPIAPYPYANHNVDPPVALDGRYPMAGNPHSTVTIGVYHRATGQTVYLESEKDVDQYWTNVTFSPAGDKVLVALVNRAQNMSRLVRFDAATGAREKVLFTETDPRWIEPEHGPIFLPDGSSRFLWLSSRSDYHHLHLHEFGGAEVGRVTFGKRDVHEFVGFTSDGGPLQALFLASDEDPRQMHLWTSSLAEFEESRIARRKELERGLGRATPERRAEMVTELTRGMRRITRARGWHACSVSDDGTLVLDRHSNLVSPGALDVLPVAAEDRQARRIATATDPSGGSIPAASHFFDVTADDGTPLHGLLLLPPGVTPESTASDTRYPVLQYVYGGPHSQLVRDRWLGGANPWLHYLAHQGYVVFVLDNRGTDNRGIEFAQAVFRRLSTLEVADQIRGLDHVCALPFVDAERVGVHGWSYGGYMTLSLLLAHPDRYAAGISGAPVTDWAQYETGYTERYMDTPAENPDGYDDARVVQRAGDLKARLLLIHGTDDRTVMLSHSMRFLRACIEAGVLVDFMAYPMQQHGLRGVDRGHLYHLMTRHLADHLGR